MSLKVTSSTDIVLCAFAPSGHSIRDLLVRGRFFEGLQTHMENKCEDNENKTILGDFNSTMDKMSRDGGNKILKLCRCHSNYNLSKVGVDNGLDNLSFFDYGKVIIFSSQFDNTFSKVTNSLIFNNILIQWSRQIESCKNWIVSWRNSFAAISHRNHRSFCLVKIRLNVKKRQ